MNRRPQFDVENQLIKLLSQIDPNKEEVNSLLKNEIDWDHIFKWSEEHRVIPLLFSHIRSEYADLIPKSTFNEFQTRFQEIAKHNFARSTQLIKLVELLEKHSFPVLSYKGMTLSELAYKDVTLRQFTDIDLLVRRQDFPEIKELLISIGCRSAWDLTGKQEKAVLKYDYEFPFFYGETNTLLEVHWDFVEAFFAFDFDTEALWERTETATLYGKDIQTLSPADYLVVLCSHGSKHSWKRLSWICDIDRLVSNTKLDWNFVESLASETGSLRMVLLGLYLSREILKTELPDHINRKILADKPTVSLGDQFGDNLFEDEREPPDWTEMARIHLRMRENWGTKIKYSQRLFTAKLIDKLFMPMGRPR